MVLQGWKQHAGGEFQGLAIRKGAKGADSILGGEFQGP